MASLALHPSSEPKQLERHYTVKEVMQSWSLSWQTVTRIFQDEPGVLKISVAKRGVRSFVTLRIPQSVFERVARRLGK